MLRILFLVFFLAAAALAQHSDRVPGAPPPPNAEAVLVEVPVFPNSTCPIMGKKVSMTLWVDTELGRIYLCCKPCIKKVLADVAIAHRTAYPTLHDARNTICPVSGQTVGKDAVAVTLQGHTFQVCCPKCVPAARTHAQATLVKVTRPQIIDVGNATCPVTGAPVTPNAFVVIGDSLVHLSSREAAEQVRVDPKATLAKAAAITAKQVAAAVPSGPRPGAAR